MNASRANSVGRALVLAILASLVIVIPIASQTQTDVPKWEAVSIKPCAPNTPTILSTFSPGRMILNCQHMLTYIEKAYILNANGQRHPIWARNETTVTGPSWIMTDQYTINAKAEGTPRDVIMQGSMLQTILEDRFKLRAHRETRDIAVYALTVARSAPKLLPFREGSCTPDDPKRDPVDTPLTPDEKPCTIRLGIRGPNLTMDAQGISLDQFAGSELSRALGRLVINKTGITGLFDFHVEYANPALAVGTPTQSDIPVGPSIFTAVEQLGLKLEATKGPGEFLVIDSIERPTEN
jgi:uncharacterized protein (TIGR03435 family)